MFVASLQSSVVATRIPRWTAATIAARPPAPGRRHHHPRRRARGRAHGRPSPPRRSASGRHRSGQGDLHRPPPRVDDPQTERPKAQALPRSPEGLLVPGWPAVGVCPDRQWSLRDFARCRSLSCPRSAYGRPLTALASRGSARSPRASRPAKTETAGVAASGGVCEGPNRRREGPNRRYTGDDGFDGCGLVSVDLDLDPQGEVRVVLAGGLRPPCSPDPGQAHPRSSCVLTSLPRLKSWDSRALMRRPVGFAFHWVPDFGMSLHAL